MAFRKETIKKQVNELIAAELQPGDEIVGGVYGLTGPSPWLMNELGVIAQLFIDYYFIAVTRQQIILVQMNRVTNRPREIEVAVPLQSVRISDVKRRPLWSSFRFQMPDAPKPRRLNIHRLWRTELDAFAGAFGAPVG